MAKKNQSLERSIKRDRKRIIWNSAIKKHELQRKTSKGNFITIQVLG